MGPIAMARPAISSIEDQRHGAVVLEGVEHVRGDQLVVEGHHVGPLGQAEDLGDVVRRSDPVMGPGHHGAVRGALGQDGEVDPEVHSGLVRHAGQLAGADHGHRRHGGGGPAAGVGVVVGSAELRGVVRVGYLVVAHDMPAVVRDAVVGRDLLA